jgi:hypothetical protein
LKLPCLLILMTGAAAAQQPANPDAKLVAEFESRVTEYVKLHKQIKSKLPLKPTDAAAKITAHQDNFSAQLVAARSGAKQGDLFTAPIASEIRRLVSIAMAGKGAHRVRQSLQRAEPVRLRLRVNDVYPRNIPLQSMPPTLLANLPRLPADLEYRVIGNDLVLRDVDANVIVDFVPNAIP